MDTRFMFAAARAFSSLPTGVDPVKVSLRIRGSVQKASPTLAGFCTVSRLITPGGKPASAKISIIALAHNGVLSAGFRITVQPAARAGASLRVIIERSEERR